MLLYSSQYKNNANSQFGFSAVIVLAVFGLLAIGSIAAYKKRNENHKTNN